MSNVLDFYGLLDKYGSLPAPLEGWTTADLVRLIDIIDGELQNRAPPDSSPAPVFHMEISDDDY